jgi:hypothetical protein
MKVAIRHAEAPENRLNAAGRGTLNAIGAAVHPDQTAPKETNRDAEATSQQQTERGAGA